MDNKHLYSQLEEMVIDGNQIVLLKAFSEKHSLETWNAKKIFEQFAQSDPQRHLEMSYILTGIVKQNNSGIYRVILSNEDQLEKAKANFSQLHSCVVFSIQKLTVKDSGLFYSSNLISQSENKTARPPLIRSSSISQSIIKPTTTKVEESERKVPEKEKPQKAVNTKISEKPLVVKKEPKTSVVASGKSSRNSVKKNSNSQRSLASSFAKTVPKASDYRKVEDKQEDRKTRKQQRDLLSSSSDEDEEIVRPVKKMSRIMPMSDSDSDVESPLLLEDKKDSLLELSVQEPLSEEPIPSQIKETDDKEDEENVIPPTPGKIMVCEPVVENYVDEDGFLVTKKRKTMVELKGEQKTSQAPPQKGSNLNRQSTKILQQKKKQPSISSFFVKKT